jgi:hypothetical protein
VRSPLPPPSRAPVSSSSRACPCVPPRFAGSPVRLKADLRGMESYLSLSGRYQNSLDYFMMAVRLTCRSTTRSRELSWRGGPLACPSERSGGEGSPATARLVDLGSGRR